jgi:hypothetical protein
MLFFNFSLNLWFELLTLPVIFAVPPERKAVEVLPRKKRFEDGGPCQGERVQA